MNDSDNNNRDENCNNTDNSSTNRDSNDSISKEYVQMLHCGANLQANPSRAMRVKDFHVNSANVSTRPQSNNNGMMKWNNSTPN